MEKISAMSPKFWIGKDSKNGRNGLNCHNSHDLLYYFKLTNATGAAIETTVTIARYFQIRSDQEILPGL